MNVGIGVRTGIRFNLEPRVTLSGAVFYAAVLGLQVFLSRRKSRWPGLVLPGACAVCASVNVMNAARTGASGGIIVAMLALYSGPILVLLIFYALCRWSLRRRQKEAL